MKKFLVFCFCGLLLLSSSVLASPVPPLHTAAVSDTIQTSFENYIRTELTPVYSTYEGSRYSLLFLKGDSLLGTKNGWIKTKTLLHKTYKLTVTSAPSSNSPQGTFEINSSTYIYPRASSAEAAAKQTKPSSTKGDTYRYTFLYENNQWKLQTAKSFDSVQRRWFTSDNDFTKTLRCPDEKH